jgi:hypothetical protein
MPLSTARAAAPISGFVAAEAVFSSLVSQLQSSDTARMTHSDLEQLLEREGRELMRQLLQAHLDQRTQATVATPVVGADRVLRTHARHGTRALETIVGTVEVSRAGHGARGCETLFPADAGLNLPRERYSFGVRRRAAEEAIKGSFDEVVAVFARHSGAAVAKRQVEAVVRRAAEDFDSFYFERRLHWSAETAASSTILVLTFDGKGVPVRHADLRPATQAAATARQFKLSTRLSKGEKRHTRRMAQVAAVYTTAPFVRTAEDIIRELGPPDAPRAERPRPEGKRVWASLSKEPAEVIDEAFLDASSRDPKREKHWAVLVDGNADQIARARAAAKRHGVAATIVLDLLHVLEYLWKAAYVFHPEGSVEAERWVRERLLWLLCGDVGQVIASIRRTATYRGLSASARKPADAAAKYLEHHKAYLRYDQYLDAGLPIATGVIEGACRHLIRDRLTLTGARWSLAGAEAILRLRSLRASGDWDEYWHYHEAKEHERNHASKYASGDVPPLTPPKPATGNARRLTTTRRFRIVK